MRQDQQAGLKRIFAPALLAVLTYVAIGQTASEVRAQGGHDLGLSPWGPYSNAYLGLSHLPDIASGMRFDLTVFAGPHTTSTPDVPNASLNTGYVAWEAAPDLSYYSYRQKLDGQRVFAEISFASPEKGSGVRLVRVDLVNGGSRPHTFTLNMLASMQLPNRAAGAVLTPRRILRANLPVGSHWQSGPRYLEYRRAKPTPQDGLVYDGWIRGEVRGDGYVDGRALHLKAGDRVIYPRAGAADTVVLRYRAKSPVRLAIEGAGTIETTLPAAPDGGSHVVPFAPNARTVGITTATAMDVEGLAFVPAESTAAVRFDAEDVDTTPERLPGPARNSIILKYRQAPPYYGLRWFEDDGRIREFRNGTLDFLFARRSHSKGMTVAQGDGRGHYMNLLLGGHTVPAGGRKTIWAVAAAGSLDAVQAQLGAPRERAALERTWAKAKARAAAPATLPAGDRYALSRQLITANLLMNVVYPVYTQDQFIRHFTPGKWWDSLYTWDSGFIGLGLAEVSPGLSADVLRAYTTAPGAQSAFIHHGTPLPVQHHQFLELWNLTQDRQLLSWAYPRLRQYYGFLVGRAAGSTFATLPSGLLKSWDYFYNSGGWDDLPPQMRVHEARLAPHAAPMVTTSHAIRAAKTLRMAAIELGRHHDVAQYEADIARLASAIQTSAWDPATGYFGYVVHDLQGQPKGVLRTASGENWNKTLDGVQPLVAGITTPVQTRALLANLRDPAKLFSPIGITAVDQSASYYRPDGYWNGTVWFPHQWFAWKALLDQGEAALAWQVARTALDTYQAEAEASWTSAEHFEIATGRGNGWHQFSGLSAPIANWYSAYFVPGRLSTGFDIWVRARSDRVGHRGMSAKLAIYSARTTGFISVLATLAPDRKYRARWNGRSIEAIELHPGAYELRIPLTGKRSGTLHVVPM